MKQIQDDPEVKSIIDRIVAHQITLIRDGNYQTELMNELNTVIKKKGLHQVAWVIDENCEVSEIYNYLPSAQKDIDQKTIDNLSHMTRKATGYL